MPIVRRVVCWCPQGIQVSTFIVYSHQLHHFRLTMHAGEHFPPTDRFPQVRTTLNDYLPFFLQLNVTHWTFSVKLKSLTFKIPITSSQSIHPSPQLMWKVTTVIPKLCEKIPIDGVCCWYNKSEILFNMQCDAVMFNWHII